MRIDGIQLAQGSNISNLVVASGTSFPTSPDEGELFFRTDTAITVKGLHAYINGSWDRIASSDSLTAPVGASLPATANAGDLYYLDSNGIDEGLYAYNGSSWNAIGSGGGSATYTITGDVTGTIDGGTDALTLADVATAGTYRSVTINSKGLVTSGTNPTTLTGYGITDAQPLDGDLTAIAGLAGTTGYAKKTAANTWTLDTNTYLTANQNINFSGDVSGSGTTSVSLTLATVATAGTYGSASAVPVTTINAKGLVTSVTNTSIQIAETQITDGALLARLAANETVAGSWTFSNAITGDLVGNADTATALATARSISATGDATWTTSFNGSANATGALTLATVNATTGTFGTANSVGTFTVNAKGLVTAASNTSIQISESQITDGALLARLGSNETVAGTWTFSNAVTGVDPTAAAHLATKNYVDNAVLGLTWKLPVKVATTANITLSGTQTIDGVAVVAADRVLVKNQTTTSQNGVYVVAAGAWTRATDFDNTAPIDEVNSAAVFVTSGTTNADTGWTQTAAVSTIGTDPITFVQFSAAGSYTAGAGLSQSGNAFNVGTASTARIVVNADNIDLATVTDAGTGTFKKVTVDTFGRVSGTTAVVAGDITALVDSEYVNVTGDTMSGDLILDNAVYLRSKTVAAAGTRLFGLNASDLLYIGGIDTALTGLLFVNNGAEQMRLNSSGVLSVSTGGANGAVATRVGVTSVTPTLQVAGATVGTSSLGLSRWQADVSYPATFFSKSRGAAVGTHTIVASGDTVGGLNFLGSDGAKFVETARIFASVDGTPGTDDMPGRLSFATTADGFVSATEHVRIDSAGRLNVGNAALAATTAPGINVYAAANSTFGVMFVKDTTAASATAQPGISLQRDGGGTGFTSPSLFFDVGSGGGNASLHTIREGGTGGNLVISTDTTSGVLTERMRLDSAGNVLIGTSTLQSVAGGSRMMQLEGGTTAGLSIVRNTADSLQPVISLGKSRGTTAGAVTIVQANDTLGSIKFSGADGATLIGPSAEITAFVDGTPGVGDVPGRLVFSTSPDGTVIPVERMRISADGSITAGQFTTTSFTQSLANADAVAGKRLLLTFPGPLANGWVGTVRVANQRSLSDATGTNGGWHEFKVVRSGGGTGANSYFTVHSQVGADVAGSIGGTFSTVWYHDTATGISYLRFGHAANTMPYHVEVSVSLATAVPTLSLDAGTAPSGSVVSPSYSFTTADIANTLAIGTGGTERLRVDASGNVQIGTTAFVAKLAVNGTAHGTQGVAYIRDNTAASSSVIPGLVLNRDGASNGHVSPSVYFDIGGGGGNSSIYAVREAAAGGNLVFATETTGGAMTERMRISSAGFVGIGTGSTAPADALEVLGNIRVSSITAGGYGIFNAASSTGGASIEGYQNAAQAFVDIDAFPATSVDESIIRMHRGSTGTSTNSGFYIYNPGTATNTFNIRAGTGNVTTSGTIFATGTITGGSFTGSVNAFNVVDANTERNPGLLLLTNTTGSTNFQTAAGIALEARRSSSSSASAMGSFQLFSNNATSNTDFYFRKISNWTAGTPNVETWTAWQKVLTDLNFASVLGGTYVDITGDTMTGDLAITKTANANVGVTVTNANAGVSADARLTLSNGTDTAGVIMRGTANSVGASQAAVFVSGANPITFYTNGSERMRVDSVGLGIGAAAANRKIEIFDAGRAIMRTNNTASSGTDILGGLEMFSHNGTAFAVGAYLYHRGNTHSIDPNSVILNVVRSAPLIFSTNDIERTRWDGATGDITHLGQLTLSRGGNSTIARGNTSGYLSLSGGSDLNNGPNIQLGGSTSATFANLMVFRNGTNNLGVFTSGGTFIVSGTATAAVGAERILATHSNAGATATALAIQNTGTTSGSGTTMTLMANTNSTAPIALAGITGLATNATGSGDLVFSTALSGTGAFKGRITSGGTLIVGDDTAPISTEKLLVKNTTSGSTTLAAMFRNAGTTTGTGVQISFATATNFLAGVTLSAITSVATDALGTGDLTFGTSATASLSEKMRITGLGFVTIGSASDVAPRPVEIAGGNTSGSTNIVNIETVSANQYSGITIVRNDNATAQLGATINLARTRGAADGAVTVVTTGDTLGGIAFSGADGTDIRTNAAEILAMAEGTVGANVMPGRLVFSTTAAGGATPTERMRINSGGVVTIGTGTSRVLTSTAPMRLQVEAIDNNAGVSVTRNSADTAGGNYRFYKTRGTAVNTNTAVVSGDSLGHLTWFGADGTGPIPSVEIRGEVDGTPGTNDMPGRLVFYTTADGAATSTERARFDSAGRMLLGLTTTSSSSALQVQATATSGLGLSIYGRSADDISILNFYSNAGTEQARILVAQDDSMLFGNTAAATTRLVIDGATGVVVVGNASSSATPSAGTLRGTAGSGTDIAGAALTIAGGQSTGTGAGGSIVFQTSPTGGATSATANALTTRMTINTLGGVSINAASAGTTLSVGGVMNVAGIATFSGATTYTGFAAAQVVNYTGETTQFGMVFKPATSVATTRTISFLTSASTAGSPVELASIRHLASNASVDLTGTWTVGGNTIVTSATTAFTTITATGAVTSSGTAGVGYSTGAGGAATAQATSRTTGVTLNKICGSITLFSTTTTAGQVTTFTFTNSTIAATDVVHASVKTATGVYFVSVTATAAGSCNISVYSPAAVAVAEAPVLNFAVIKAVAA
jgi:hypothetical protein